MWLDMCGVCISRENVKADTINDYLCGYLGKYFINDCLYLWLKAYGWLNVGCQCGLINGLLCNVSENLWRILCNRGLAGYKCLWLSIGSYMAYLFEMASTLHRASERPTEISAVAGVASPASSLSALASFSSAGALLIAASISVYASAAGARSSAGAVAAVATASGCGCNLIIYLYLYQQKCMHLCQKLSISWLMQLRNGYQRGVACSLGWLSRGCNQLYRQLLM